MADFQFIKKPLSQKWSILDPRRSTRPDAAHEAPIVCPFCPGSEEEELDRTSDPDVPEQWLVRVLPNAYPFTPFHELIIHSPDHHKNIDELPTEQVVNILSMYRKRSKVHLLDGNVVLFHNRGEQAGESIPHPHTQLAVLPHFVRVESPVLSDLLILPEGQMPFQTKHFSIVCPRTSDWPQEVVIAPHRRKQRFVDINEEEIIDLAKTLQGALQGLSGILQPEFPFNFYVYPLFDWYLRIIPRQKTLGGFEVATGIPVVTADPAETMRLLQEQLQDIL